MPVGRTLSSTRAGVVPSPVAPPTLVSAIVLAFWCGGRAGAGVALGSSWEHFHENWRDADYAVVFLVVLGVGYGAFKLLRRRARRRAIQSPTEG